MRDTVRYTERRRTAVIGRRSRRKTESRRTADPAGRLTPRRSARLTAYPPSVSPRCAPPLRPPHRRSPSEQPGTGHCLGAVRAVLREVPPPVRPHDRAAKTGLPERKAEERAAARLRTKDGRGSIFRPKTPEARDRFRAFRLRLYRPRVRINGSCNLPDRIRVRTERIGLPPTPGKPW